MFLDKPNKLFTFSKKGLHHREDKQFQLVSQLFSKEFLAKPLLDSRARVG